MADGVNVLAVARKRILLCRRCVHFAFQRQAHTPNTTPAHPRNRTQTASTKNCQTHIVVTFDPVPRSVKILHDDRLVRVVVVPSRCHACKPVLCTWSHFLLFHLGFLNHQQGEVRAAFAPQSSVRMGCACVHAHVRAYVCAYMRAHVRACVCACACACVCARSVRLRVARDKSVCDSRTAPQTR
jgi:hypothetical protein